jgi:hypothetical protein
MKSGSLHLLEPSGPVQAFTFYLKQKIVFVIIFMVFCHWKKQSKSGRNGNVSVSRPKPTKGCSAVEGE